MLTSEKTTQMFSTISMFDAVNEATVLVGLHASLDTVKREGSQRREDARRAGSYFGPITLDERVCVVSWAGGGRRHDCCRDEAAWNILLLIAFCFHRHASGQVRGGRLSSRDTEQLEFPGAWGNKRRRGGSKSRQQGERANWYRRPRHTRARGSDPVISTKATRPAASLGCARAAARPNYPEALLPSTGGCQSDGRFSIQH